MTFFIACLLIHNFGMGGGWYFAAFVVWILHLMAHGSGSK